MVCTYSHVCVELVGVWVGGSEINEVGGQIKQPADQ